MVENKEVMARNIKRYMALKGVKAQEICQALGFKPNTFSDWVNAKGYPRIDKIEKMANYFGISKAYLVEESPDLMLSEKERELILRYRQVDDVTQGIIDKILSGN